MLPAKARSKLQGLPSIVLVCLFVTVLLVLSPVRRSTTSASEELVQISPGTSKPGEINAGGKAVFVVSADEGTLLRFSIDKGDLGLTTTVYSPTSAKLVTHVSEDFETVDLSVPVDISGTYRIEIQSREKVNNVRRYELRVEALSSLKPAGRKDSEARQAMAVAGGLRAEWKEASLRQSINEYDRAALLWSSLGDFSSASQASLRSGELHFLLSDYSEALKRFKNAIDLAAKTGDRLSEAKARSRIGRLYSFTGRNDLAQNELDTASHILSADADTNPIVRNTYGEILSNIGEVIYSKGNMVKASEQFELALKFLEGDRKGEAKVHLFSSYIAGTIGMRDKAIAEISKALELYQATNDKSGEGLALTLLGLAHSVSGKPNSAIELDTKAIEVFQIIGDRNSEAIAFNAVGQVYENVKDFSTALSNYERARQIFHDRGAVDFEAGTILKVAQMQVSMGHLDQALSLYESCLRLSRSAKKVRTEANALSDIAIVYATQRRSKDTLQQYARLLKFYEDINDRRGQAVALNARGTFLLQTGQKAEAAKAFRRALPLSEQAVDVSLIISTYYNLARAERSFGHLDEALSVINRSLKMIENLRTDVGSPELRASYFSGVQSNYELCREILIDLEHAQPGKGFAEQALLLSEQSRARLLVDLIRESGADLRRGALPELVSRERELSGLIQRQAQYKVDLKLSGKDESEIAEVENQLSPLRLEYQRIQAEIREQNPRALSLAQFEPLSLQDIQKELRADDVLLEFSLGQERSHLWVVTAGSFQYFELPAGQTIEDHAIEFYKLVTERPQVDQLQKELIQKAAQLSQMLFGQIATQLENKRLVLVTEGALQLVPYDALPLSLESAPKYLMEDHEIVQLPSIATLRAIRAEKKNHNATGKIAAVIADPVFTKSDTRVQGSSLAVASAAPGVERNESTERAVESLRRSGGPARLIYSAEEADAIAAAAPSGTTMIAKGFDATRETAMDPDLGEYQIVHFATHGFLDSEHPEFSSIVLTMVDKNGVEKNGVMPLHDIYNLDLSAELTVLSACQTALGKDIKGEGFVGLTHSFISAGSRSVVASLWKVDDRATATLMADLYQSMLQKGMSPAAALRAAKLKVMQDKRWSAPYFWAGFVVQGEYTNHINLENNSWRHRGVIVLVSLLLISSGVVVWRRLRTRRTS
ncbi:MAG TPA: CHAT domain-containing tetratricopeptide repeat protein [Pyrinomonadaceae bacterium]|nr:CHAT domain-containing tetratricopeptide repeat protein [Pyrinomonadaceae bacterium]